MTRISLYIALFLLPGITSLAQVEDSVFSEEAYMQKYNENIQKEYMDGVYIPKNMSDAFVELKRLASENALSKFKAAREENIKTKLHFGLGRWITLNWKLYQGSRFSHYLKTKGISHPDDMVQYSIISFHRHLNNVPLELEERAKKHEENRKILHQKKVEGGKILKRTKRKN